MIVDDGRKLGFHSWHLVPRAAICDPGLTLSLPPQLTAATGMDAIAHCMETFMSAAFNPPADGIALDGLERGWHHIETATRDGQDRDARLAMMSASMQGAMAFQKGLGCVHSLSHSLGGLNPRLHHGTLNAVFLPAVVRFNAQAESVRKERRLERMAHAMGLAFAGDISDAIRDMNARLGLPTGLAALGAAVGMMSTLVGAGGAVLLVPALTWFNIPFRRAIGTGAAIGLPIAFTGTIAHVLGGLGEPGLPEGAVGYVWLPALVPFVIASMLLAPAGARLSHRVPVRTLRRVFAGTMFLLAIRMAWSLARG